MHAVHNYYRPGAPAVGSVHQTALFSCIMRFAGALSGEVMDIILPADIILPKPMFTSFTDILPLFYILYLFAYLLYLALACDNEIDYVAIVGLGADRVELTVHFLHYEVQLSA